MTTTSNISTARKSESGSAFEADARARQLFADSASTLAMLGDFTMIVCGLVLGYWLRFRSGLIPLRMGWWAQGDRASATLGQYASLIAVGTIILFITFLSGGLYRRSNLLRYRQVVLIVIRGTFTWLFVYTGLSMLLEFHPNISRIYVALSFLTVNAAVMTWRALFHRLLQTESAARGLRQNILLIGWNKNVTRLVEEINADKSHPYRVVGCLQTPDGRSIECPIPGIRQFDDYGQLRDLVIREMVHIVVLADTEMPREDILSLSNFCERELIHFKVIPSYFQILVSGLHLETISGVPIMGVSALPLDHPANQIIKRIIDIFGSLVGLALSLPIILICGFMIYRESPGSVFYSQVRTGRNGRNFRIYKLRSMKLDAEKGTVGWSTKNDDRRLKIGSTLRRLNLDELPQFWNVLKGEMSLVGPRPERPELIAKFRYDIPHYNARLGSKPGITGWAQVHGLRGDTDLAERVRYDLYYLENWTPLLDFQIMFMTFLRRDNAY